MHTIGIVAPKDKSRRFKMQTFHNAENDIDFCIVNDNKNYNRIFKKLSPSSVVFADGAKAKYKPNFAVSTGELFYKKHIVYFLAKQYKIYGLQPNNSTLALVFDKYDSYINSAVIQLSKLFKDIVFVTNNVAHLLPVADALYEQYGMFIMVKDITKPIDCTVSCELIKYRIKYKNNPIIININSNLYIPPEYNISIPISVNKAALAEAIMNAKQNY